MNRNPYLLTMVLIGSVLVVTGIVWAVLSVNLVVTSSDILKGSLGIQIGILAGSVGGGLLLIAWIIAAATWKRSE